MLRRNLDFQQGGLNFWQGSLDFWQGDLDLWQGALDLQQSGLDLWQFGKILKVALSASLKPTAAQDLEPGSMQCLRRTSQKKKVARHFNAKSLDACILQFRPTRFFQFAFQSCICNCCPCPWQERWGLFSSHNTDTFLQRETQSSVDIEYT